MPLVCVVYAQNTNNIIVPEKELKSVANKENYQACTMFDFLKTFFFFFQIFKLKVEYKATMKHSIHFYSDEVLPLQF